MSVTRNTKGQDNSTLHGALLRTLLALQIWDAGLHPAATALRERGVGLPTLHTPTHTHHHITHCSSTATIAQPPDCRLASGLLVTIRIKDELALLLLHDA